MCVRGGEELSEGGQLLRVSLSSVLSVNRVTTTPAYRHGTSVTAVTVTGVTACLRTVT